MAEVNINLSDYKASGVYFLEIDNSIVNSTSVESALRLAVGFNMKGPFNRPVYLANAKECTNLFGDIDRRLERRGCFTNRAIRTMLKKSPVYAINLLSVDCADKDTNPDTVGCKLFSLSPKDYRKDASLDGTRPYAFMYDRSKFWVADDNALIENSFAKISGRTDASAGGKTTAYAGIFGAGNCGTKDMSIIVRKAEGLTGYNVTFLDWYGSKDNIPYSWINPNDIVADYFVQVVAVSGDWGKSNYASLAADAVWKDYFTADGLKREKFSKFIKLDAVNVVGNWTGCIIPDFVNKQGTNMSIDYMINSKCNETGLLFGLNKKAMEKICLDVANGKYFYDEVGDGKFDEEEGDVEAYFAPDFVGHTIKASDSSAFNYMSCVIPEGRVAEKTISAAASYADSSTCIKVEDASFGEFMAVGDYVRAANGMLTKIVKKRKVADGSIYYKYTCYDIPAIDASGLVCGQKSLSEMYDSLDFAYIKGLKICNRHMPGFDASGAEDNEAGVEKIYSMLMNDSGIKKGLKNDEMINFRYIVDTMAFGLGDKCGAKKYLSDFAREKGHCTAIISAPSMTQFAASDEPFFGDTYSPSDGDARPFFNPSYIPQGGNPDMPYSAETEFFTLPDMEYGADHCGVFGPFFKYKDGSRTILVPPAADVSNTFMNKFMGGDPYKTVANLNGIISNGDITGVEYIFDEEDREYLEPFGYNPIILRNGVPMIFGDKTAYQEVNSDLNCLHVRELLNTIEISCKAVLDDYVFGYNEATTRAEIISRINPILSAMKDSKALVKYEIQCDRVNNTNEVINARSCIVNIGVWITQNMERIIVPITINRSTTASEQD